MNEQLIVTAVIELGASGVSLLCCPSATVKLLPTGKGTLFIDAAEVGQGTIDRVGS